jgi:hypothetical protein
LDTPPSIQVEPLARESSDDASSTKPIAAIQLDLSTRRQKIRIEPSVGQQLRIGAVENCTLPYALQPEDGQFTDKASASIVIDASREVKIKVIVEAPGDRPPAIAVEPVVLADSGFYVPFTIENLERIRGRVEKSLREAQAQLSDMEAEKERLTAWIEAPVVKPLAQRGQARIRVAELEKSIPEQKDFIAGLANDVETAKNMLDLAHQLSGKCKVIVTAPKD